MTAAWFLVIWATTTASVSPIAIPMATQEACTKAWVVIRDEAIRSKTHGLTAACVPTGLRGDSYETR